MGTKHLQQMYNDAMALDRRALPLAVSLMQLCVAEHHESRLNRGLWSARHVDDIMGVARRLLSVGDEFYDDLKQMLVVGDVRVHMVDNRGRPRKITDPDVIDFDEPVASEEKLFDAIVQCPRTTLDESTFECLLEN